MMRENTRQAVEEGQTSLRVGPVLLHAVNLIKGTEDGVQLDALLMTRPQLREIPLTEAAFDGAHGLFSVGSNQPLDDLLLKAYSLGYIILQLGDNGRPTAAYRRCGCDLCQHGTTPEPEPGFAALRKAL